MTTFLVVRFHSLSLFAMMMCKTSIQDGTKFYGLRPRSHRTMLSLYNLRRRESDQLKIVLELHDMEIHQKISMSNHQKLKTMVKRSVDQQLRLRNCNARNEKIETGAVVTSRRGLSVFQRGKGSCYQWKTKGQCSRGDQCTFRTRIMIVKNRHQKQLHPLINDTRQSASRKRSFRGRSQSGKFNRLR